MALFACAQLPTPTPDSIDNRQRRVEETFACSDLSNLLVYVSVDELQADPSTKSGFALSGERIETEEPGIIGATVGAAERRTVSRAPKLEDNYVRFYFSPLVGARLATATQAVENPGSGFTVHFVRNGNPLYSATVTAPLADGSAEVHLNHRDLEPADEFIPTQQQRLCPAAVRKGVAPPPNKALNADVE